MSASCNNLNKLLWVKQLLLQLHGLIRISMIKLLTFK